MNIYFYKMTTDNGGAPCVHEGVLSLAICKPKIRRRAQVGDLVFGFGGRRLGGRLIYAAYVTEKPKVGDYYRKRTYQSRPDCIYREVNGRTKRKAKAQFHFDSDHSTKDVGKRFKKAFVLLNSDFRYFGSAGTADYLEHYKHLAKAFHNLTQGHRVNHKSKVREDLCRLAEKLWADFDLMRNGDPCDGGASRRCNSGTQPVRC